MRIKRLAGRINHYTAPDIVKYREKAEHYARLRARSYFEMRRHSHLAFLTPLFHFLKSYVLLAGFLDGRIGLELAIIAYAQCRLKYKQLGQLRRNQGRMEQEMPFNAYSLQHRWSRS
jgi:(heptosyl)LPS beta-1,4-glucosyltransferase